VELATFSTFSRVNKGVFVSENFLKSQFSIYFLS
jgi:hypothetical protein